MAILFPSIVGNVGFVIPATAATKLNYRREHCHSYFLFLIVRGSYGKVTQSRFNAFDVFETYANTLSIDGFVTFARATKPRAVNPSAPGLSTVHRSFLVSFGRKRTRRRERCRLTHPIFLISRCLAYVIRGITSLTRAKCPSDECRAYTDTFVFEFAVFAILQYD